MHGVGYSIKLTPETPVKDQTVIYATPYAITMKSIFQHERRLYNWKCGASVKTNLSTTELFMQYIDNHATEGSSKYNIHWLFLKFKSTSSLHWSNDIEGFTYYFLTKFAKSIRLCSIYSVNVKWRLAWRMNRY